LASVEIIAGQSNSKNDEPLVIDLFGENSIHLPQISHLALVWCIKQMFKKCIVLY
jgi:hypothetical protein